MQDTDARRILGVSDTADADEARAAYRARLLRTHPDVSGSGDATERTVELTRAYRLVMAGLAAATPHTSTSHTSTSHTSTPSASTVGGAPSNAPNPPTDAEQPATPERDDKFDTTLVELVDPTTIGIGAPANEALMLLIDAAHELGEISYLDPSAGLLEVVVEFVEAPTSSVLLSLQGRATGITEVFCTVEPLSGGVSPPSDAVTRLLLHTLRGRTRTS